jgi:adenosylmethionine-8-amino-7-oxononanoate aminotransferase
MTQLFPDTAAGTDQAAVAALVEQDVRHVLHPGTSLHDQAVDGPNIFVSADGVRIKDIHGRWYIDAYAGMGNCVVGYGRQEIVEAASAQLRQMAFVPTYFRGSNVPSIELATKLAELTPAGLERAFFSSGGAEANETAFKIARLYFSLQGRPQKTKILYKRYGYHGVTLGTLSANGNQAYRSGFGPLMDGFLEVASTYCYRCDLGKTYPACQLACADDLEQRILSEGPETVAAFIAEPISGVGGHLLSPPGYLRRVREICDRYEVLFIADEVVTGFGRTGRWFGVDHEAVVPDMMSFAKGLSSGYLPLGAVVVHARVSEQLLAAADDFVFTHGYTYSGHPTCCAAALANIGIIERDGLVEKSRQDGAYLLEQLQRLTRLDIVGEVRGLGLLAAVDLTRDKASRAPFNPSQQVGKRIGDRMFSRGVIARTGHDTITLRPPLSISREDIDEVVAVIERSIEDVQHQL